MKSKNLKKLKLSKKVVTKLTPNNSQQIKGGGSWPSVFIECASSDDPCKTL